MKNVMWSLLWCVLVASVRAEEEQVVTTDPGAVVSFAENSRQREYTLVTANGIEFKIVFCRSDVFRILAAPDGKFADPLNKPDKAQIVIDNSLVKDAIEVENGEEQIVLSTKALTLRVNKADCSFELLSADNDPIWKEVTPLQFGSNTVQTLSTGLDEYFYGGGQQNGYFSHKGTKIEIRADGNWNEGGHPNPAPFYMSSRGYGVLRNTFATGAYDFTSNQSIALEHNENRFDSYYFVGDSLNRIVDLYTQFTGRPNFVTMWALELGDADAYMTRDKKTKELLKDENGDYVETTPDCIENCAKKYRDNDMPGGWILVNDGYGCGYVELPMVVKGLEKLGFYTGLWTEKALDQIKWEIGSAGIRVQKLDVAWTGPAYQFSLEANKVAWEALNKYSNSRGLVWTVQGWAGTQRYAVCWTGDQYGSWDLIRYHIPTLIGSGLSGQAYATTDVDGNFGGSPETYTRDLQWKCFTPVLYVMNGWSHMNKSPWAYDEPYISINRKYLKLKMRLTPYMYKYTKEAYDTGAPIVRGMLWEFPEDEKTWDKSTQHQYMLGESMLVAPVFTSMNLNKGWRKEDIYLPAGGWIDYWDGRVIEGPLTIDNYPVTLGKLPVFIKAGAIIPMYPEMLYNNQKPKDPLTFDIYPSGASSFEMYEDDGVSRKYQKGEYSLQTIAVVAPETEAGDIRIMVGKSQGKFDGKLKKRTYQFEIHSQLKPLSLTLDGEGLKETSDEEEGWYYDKDDRRGIIHVCISGKSTQKSFGLYVDIDETQSIPDSPAYPIPEITSELDVSEFTLACSSSQGAKNISKAFDGTPETYWHSKYGKDAGKHPYIIDIGIGRLAAINGIQYLPRQNGENGRIAEFEVYVSRVSTDLGKPVYMGTFENTNALQSAEFPVKWGEFVRIKILSDVNGTTHGSAAEFTIMQDLDAPPLTDEIVYLSDLEPTAAKGSYEKDLSYGKKAITVNEQTYKKGIGVSSPSELVYKLDGSWDRLSGHVGMDDEVGSGGSVMFRVFADDKLVFESPEMNGDNIKQLMELEIKGVKELRLVLLDNGDGSKDDHGDWVDVKLVRKGSE